MLSGATHPAQAWRRVASGLLSPALAREFAHPYVKKIIDAVQTDTFGLIYHNCGDNVSLMAEDIYALGALGYHFGDAVNLAARLQEANKDLGTAICIGPAAAAASSRPLRSLGRTDIRSFGPMQVFPLGHSPTLAKAAAIRA